MVAQYAGATEHWDAAAIAPYLSIDQSGASGDRFITYDDSRSITSKVDYVVNNNLGGFIIWSIGQGYFPSASAGQKNPLLNSIKLALGSPTAPPPPPAVDNTAPLVTVTSPTHLAVIPKNTYVNISASATDNVGVIEVRIRVNGSQICSVKAAGAVCRFRTGAGRTYKIQASGLDAAGNVGTSTEISVRSKR